MVSAFFFFKIATKNDTESILASFTENKKKLKQRWDKCYCFTFCSTDGVHYYGQIAAENDCLYRYMYKTEYAAFIDLDEFIIPRGSLRTWDDLVDDLHTTLGDKMRNACAFTFLKNQFYTNYSRKKSKNTTTNRHPVMDTDSQILNKNWDGILRPLVGTMDVVHLVAKNDIKSLKSFTRDRDTDPGDLNKMIVIPRKIGALDVHHVEFPLVSEETYQVNNDTATVHHYRVPWPSRQRAVSLGVKFIGLFTGLDYHVTSDKTMVKYADELVKRVQGITKTFEKWITDNKSETVITSTIGVENYGASPIKL